MAKVWKVSLFFELGDYSWSENYHYAVPDAPIAVVRGEARALAVDRLNLCGGSENPDEAPTIPYIRVSDENTRRDAYPDTSMQGNYPVLDDPAHYPVAPYDVIEVRGDIASRLRRKIYYIACLPTSVYNNPGGIFNETNAKWLEYWAQYKDRVQGTALVPSKWGLYHQRVQGVGTTIYTVEDMIQNENKVELVGVPLPAGGDRIILRRGSYEEGSPKLQGKFYTIPSTTANAIIIVPGLTAAIQYGGGAKAQLVIYDVTPLTLIDIVKKTHRKKGVMSGLAHRGRSATR